MHQSQLLIAGVPTQARQGGVFERLNPLTAQVASRAAAASADDARAAVDAAVQAFAAWSETGPTARRTLLLRAADCLQAREAAFVAAMADEVGATAGWARFNVMLAANMLREAAAITTHITGQVIPSDKPGCLAMGVRQPAGVVLGIAPWNAPVILGVRAVAWPLACGNSVVLKASEVCPHTHYLIGEALCEAGFPAGVVNVISHDAQDASAVVAAMIEHPAVRRINFTGSTRVGRLIAEAAARQLKPVLLELGGKASLLVLDDADLDEAVKATAFGAFMNQGQICMSTERVVVDAQVADAFVDKLASKAATLQAGDPRDGTCPLGAIVDKRSALALQALVEDALAKGATLVCGAARGEQLMDATVLDHVTADMRIYQEESFGPVVCVIRVKDQAQAIAVANDSEYGLAAAVFSRDIPRALQVARRIESGICHINGATVHDEPQMPFGGVKASGHGRFGGMAGVDEFTELRWITVETQAGHFPL